MGKEDLRFNYAQIDAMERLLLNLANQLQQTKTEVIKVANDMESDSFQSKAGDVLADAMKTTLAASIEALKDKVEENMRDLDKAAKDMQQFDSQGAKGFNN